MPSIAVVADTNSSLPADVAARHGIRLVPIAVHFGQETFETGVDIDDAQLFARVDHNGRLPTTSAPTPGKFAEAYRAAFDAGAETVLCFCVSGAMAANYSSALAASELFPGRDIVVIDSRSVSMGQGFMALAAAEAALAGASKDEAVTRAIALRERTHLFAALSTLKYLAMSGRVGYLAAGMGTLLSVKPILTLRDGRLELFERVRTQRKAWARVIELIERAAGGRGIERMAIVHSNAPAEARLFEAQLRASMPCPDDVLFAELSAGLSVHTGAGLVGAGFVSCPA